ncbi:hypothetical protein BSZ36_06255 [Rubricoccus marinus]|uniref:DUF4296 domain-containing protein n=2 Tax=Rubricoccus marinus TaxID=716817 RepID=A0A259TY41_9BACT|nr:hypothetical protein BSZ36_06255 [Rubricoccus marinus]
MKTPLALSTMLLLAACGESPEASGEEGAVPTDTTLAIILADLHLADARAETTGEPLDSLRALAFAHHGTDSVAVERRLREHSEQPEDVSALFGAVQDILRRPTTQTP